MWCIYCLKFDQGSEIYIQKTLSGEEIGDLVWTRRMMRRACLESMFCFRIQLIIRKNIYRKRRKFTKVSCCKCGEEFDREMHLYEHLKIDNRCMKAMGGSIKEARLYVDSMIKQESFRQDPSLTGHPSP